MQQALAREIKLYDVLRDNMQASCCLMIVCTGCVYYYITYGVGLYCDALDWSKAST
jgi:hypothetical protein